MKTIFINQREAVDIALAGGKGASLARLSQAGFNVPPAFVISADTTEEEIREGTTQTEDAFDELGSDFVSVRSSATVEDGEQASWAGQFETFLYVSKADLLNKILACKASAQSDRAQVYADQQGVTSTQVAVVVQKMVHSSTSGVGFSVNPVTQDRQEMVIEAVYGLGEALVGGLVTPDTYQVAKDGRVTAKHIASQTQKIVSSPDGGTSIWPVDLDQAKEQKLTDAQIGEVATQLMKIEKHYAQPIDIEWAYESDQLYILQARPITTLSKQKSGSASLPDWPEEEVFQWGPIRGRYFYISDYIVASFRALPELFSGESFPQTLLLFHDEHMIWLCNLGEFTSTGQRIFKKYMENTDARTRIYQEWLGKVEALCSIQNNIAKTNLSQLSDEQLHTTWHTFYEAAIDFWVPTLLPELGNYGAPGLLKDDLAKAISDEAELTAAMETLTAPEELSFYQQEELELARTQDIKAHQAKYYWLKNSYGNVQVLPEEFFEQRKSELEKDLASKSGSDIVKAQKRTKDNLQKKYGLSPEIRQRADVIAQNVVWQDERKRYSTETFHFKSLLLSEIARRKNLQPEMLLNHSYENIGKLLQADTSNVSAKPDCFGITFHTDLSELNDNEASESWDRYTQAISSETHIIKGAVASKGAENVVTGVVRVLHSSHAILEPGEILVTSMTSPGYIFAMRNAKAVITDVGGLTSHAAIVSRELNIPCIVGTKNATKVLKDGDTVEVDSVNGTVKVIGNR